MATEKRLIDANALKEKAEPEEVTGEGIVYVQDIDEAPTVDAVEVVRCKDCKHFDNSEGIQWCKINSKFYPGGFDWHSFPEDGFCSYGERKDNGQG